MFFLEQFWLEVMLYLFSFFFSRVTVTAVRQKRFFSACIRDLLEGQSDIYMTNKYAYFLAH